MTGAKPPAWMGWIVYLPLRTNQQRRHNPARRTERQDSTAPGGRKPAPARARGNEQMSIAPEKPRPARAYGCRGRCSSEQMSRTPTAANRSPPSPTRFGDNRPHGPRTFALALDPALILGRRASPPTRGSATCCSAPTARCCSTAAGQAGKSTVTAARALHTALFRPRPGPAAHPQAAPVGRTVPQGAAPTTPSAGRCAVRTRPASAAGVGQRPRVLACPARRRRSAASLRRAARLDEAAGSPDDLLPGRPAHARRQPRPPDRLSTPFGQRGSFYREWPSDGLWAALHILARTARASPRSSSTPELVLLR